MASPRLPLSGLPRRLLSRQTRPYSSQPSQQRPHHDPYALLSKPTWSVRTLLPQSSSPTTTNTATSDSTATTPTSDPEITPAQLAHLLRLSALPQPTSAQETDRMLAHLRAQLHFVRDMQRVGTDGVAPLSAIRDETPAGLREATVTVDTLRDALAQEEVVGRCRRPRRRRKVGADKGQIEGVEDWDVLGGAGERVGRYFVVRSGKGAASTAAGDADAEGVKGVA